MERDDLSNPDKIHRRGLLNASLFTAISSQIMSVFGRSAAARNDKPLVDMLHAHKQLELFNALIAQSDVEFSAALFPVTNQEKQARTKLTSEIGRILALPDNACTFYLDRKFGPGNGEITYTVEATGIQNPLRNSVVSKCIGMQLDDGTVLPKEGSAVISRDFHDLGGELKIYAARKALRLPNAVKLYVGDTRDIEFQGKQCIEMEIGRDLEDQAPTFFKIIIDRRNGRLLKKTEKREGF